MRMKPKKKGDLISGKPVRLKSCVKFRVRRKKEDDDVTLDLGGKKKR